LRYVILANPVSGRLGLDAKRQRLAAAAEILGAEIRGLDTTCREDFEVCARDAAQQADVVVAAGGDGTISDLLNTLDLRESVLGLLPLGTGNALAWALGLIGPIEAAARQIRDGAVRPGDLVLVDNGRRGYLVSVGFDGAVIQERDVRPPRCGGWAGYVQLCLRLLRRRRCTFGARLDLDATRIELDRLFNVAVVKEPYYGYGLRMVPGARLDDGQLHVRCLRGRLVEPALAGLSGSTVGNRFGRSLRGARLAIETDRPVWLQCDGTTGWEAQRFEFVVQPAAWRIKY
jgi:diacylglycerol kinase family enzyme